MTVHAFKRRPEEGRVVAGCRMAALYAGRLIVLPVLLAWVAWVVALAVWQEVLYRLRGFVPPSDKAPDHDQDKGAIAVPPVDKQVGAWGRGSDFLCVHGRVRGAARVRIYRGQGHGGACSTRVGIGM
jgi:hypothetical protein